MARRFDPLIRQQAVAYLEKRFDGDVQIASLRVRLPGISPFHLLSTGGRGSLARVEGEGISVRYHGAPDRPPLLVIKKISFGVDLGTVLTSVKTVPLVDMDGVEIHIPPNDERRQLTNNRSIGSNVSIGKVVIQNATLIILPKDRDKVPLQFDIHEMTLVSLPQGGAMRYDAALTIPKPYGAVHAKGNFGPWNAQQPADTALDGEYVLSHADLAVFSGIAGILESHGRFDGTLDTISASGEANVPDFRLKMAGNPVPLSTRFEAGIDGRNGNTILKPVVARLGSTNFTTSGAVIKHEGDRRRDISLDVRMPDGDLQDILRLGMKQAPFMAGRIALNSRIDIPPLDVKVKRKLLLDGRFEINQGRFLRTSLREKIDSFSRRGQGQPANREISDVPVAMSGKFHLQDEVMSFGSLRFGVPGGDVGMDGKYNLAAQTLDFHGILRLQAKVSQTMTGWKRWALRPVDPFFAKDGAGTLLHIKVEGTTAAPRFGLDLGAKDSEVAKTVTKTEPR